MECCVRRPARATGFVELQHAYSEAQIMTVRRLALLIGLAWAFSLCAEAEAQQIPRPNNQRYMGGPNWMQRPTISPWLDLYREDGGVVDPYNDFVRPQFRMQKYLLEQDRQAHQQQQQLRQLQPQLRQMQQQQQQQQTAIEGLQQQPGQMAPRQGFATPTGIGASYMSYGGFMTHRSYFNY
jgi:TolA-binding protein